MPETPPSRVTTLQSLPVSFGTAAFPPGTPLHAFFAWNEARRRRDRRYIVAGDVFRLFRRLGGGSGAIDACIAHLAQGSLIRWRWRDRMRLREPPPGPAAAQPEAIAAARRVVESLLASIGSADPARHAAVFSAFAALEQWVDLGALAAFCPRRAAAPPRAGAPARILVIKLSALGDFIQALGPAAAIRRHHDGARITLLTTRPYADFGRRTGLFDEVAVDPRPGPLDLMGWLRLRRWLRAGGFDRVYDLQTSDRSSLYAWLFLPGPVPEWSGIAWGCTLPHANLDRDPQHTIDKQAEQLLMAGIYPVPLPSLPPAEGGLPHGLADRTFALLIPGSSPRHPDKRWPAAQFGALATRLRRAGLAVVIVGTPGEKPLAAQIRASCPEAIDLVGQTDLAGLADLARGAALTIGNDTGATHIAAAGGRPVVVLFSSASEPSRCAPRGGVVSVLTRPRLADLSVDIVQAEALRLLAQAERNLAHATPR